MTRPDAGTVDVAPVEAAAPHIDLAADLANRTRDAKALFGARTRTSVAGGLFLLVEASSPTRLFDRAKELVERALPPLLNGRFGRKPDAAVTILFFTSKPAYVAFTESHYGRMSDGNLGAYQRSSREIAVDASGGPAFLPTLTHEIVHPLIEADFPDAPLWFDEGLASLFEAPVFSPDGGIHGERRNWRHQGMLNALAAPHGPDVVSLNALFAMGPMEFKAWSFDAGVDRGKNLLHCAMARAFVAWLDDQRKLWPFYHAWRDGFATDPTGEKAFVAVTGTTPSAANATWIAWVR